MKKGWFSTFIIFVIFLVCYTYRDNISTFVMQKIYDMQDVSLPSANSFYNNTDFEFVKKTDDFHLKDYQNILNAIYTILDNGTDEFTFYCDDSYSKCMEDFDKVSKNQILLSTINNMVSPYNSYKKIYFRVTSYGKITMKTDKLYSSDEINVIEEKMNEFISQNIKDDMSIVDKIRSFHDYLINNSIYDKESADLIENGGDTSFTSSHKATGPLIYGKSLCSGYSDAMKIYLDKIGVTNYKISNARHIWNLVYVNDSWFHLDLTWDDPITTTGENILLHKFFLIDTDTLLKLDSTEHSFNPDYYPEISH